MGLMFRDLNRALSVKSCYSRGLFSSAVLLMAMLLTAALFVAPLSMENSRSESRPELASSAPSGR